MYSHEIDQYLRVRNFLLTIKEYDEVTNVEKSPQISRVKYDSWRDNFYMATRDNYEWNFKVKKLTKD